MDVTERKEAQELFELATEASPSGTLLVDSHGQILLVNAHVQKFFGYQRDELIGKSIEALLPERFVTPHQDFRTSFASASEPWVMGQGHEMFARRKDGTEFPVEIRLNPIQAPRGLLVLASVADISARKKAEEEARRQREEIDLLSRVGLLGEMTASLAHELNQPLSAIMSNANAGMRFIDRGAANLEDLREILVDVVADGRRAHDIIANVRNTIKKGSPIRQPISLNKVITHVARLVQADATGHSCKVETSLANDLPIVEGDPTQIQQVLINLMGNAFDAMHNMPANERKVELTTERNGNNTIMVSVRDYGAGISDDTRNRLFEKFYTTKDEGLGMGLAIVRSIVESHGGKIDVENAKGGGAKFYFTLPASMDN
jgi:two-component system sensor kinase FixL